MLKMLKKSMKKLLYIHNADYSILDANKIQVANMCTSLNKFFNCKLLSTGAVVHKNFNFKKLKTEFLKTSNSYYIRSWKLFFKSIREPAQIIYTRDLLVALLTKIFTRKKVIYELHEILPNPLWKLLFSISMARIDRIITISNGLKKKISAKNVVVLPDAVDLSIFKNSKYRRNKKINVVYTGSLKPWKGTSTLYRLSEINNKEFEIVIIGCNLKDFARLSKKYPNIKFYPKMSQNNMIKIMKKADIFVIPNSDKYEISKYYTSPLKLFEYMAMKRVIIASDLPSIREIVTENDVLFFESDNELSLYNKIKRIISSPDLQNKLINNAYRKVTNQTWDNRAKNIYKLLATNKLKKSIKNI